MTGYTSYHRKGFWDFCCEHPIAVITIVVVLGASAGDVASAITGHYEHYKDGFWSSNCAEVKVP